MKFKTLFAILFIFNCVNGFSQQIVNGLANPESVVSNGKRYFVSNQGQDFDSRDADGFISEITADGKLIEH